MTTVKYQKDFIKEFKKLPKNIKEKAIELEDIFKENPFNSLLNTKALAGKLSHLFSFRVTREYRIIFIFSSKDEVLFLHIGHRKDIYK